MEVIKCVQTTAWRGRGSKYGMRITISSSGTVGPWATCQHPVPVAQGFQSTMPKCASCRGSCTCDTMTPPTSSRRA